MLVQLLVNGLIAGSIYALVALGFSLIYNTARFFNFAHAAVYTAAVYFAYSLKNGASLPDLVAYPLACAAAAALGVSLELLIYRPMRRRGAGSLELLLASLGAYTVLENLISLIWGSDTKTLRTGAVAEGANIFGARVTVSQLVIMATSALLVTAVSLLLLKTKVGTALRAVANDPELAAVSGIETDSFRLLAFAVGSGLAGAASLLISFETNIAPAAGFPMLVMGVIAMVVGGIGSLRGATLGGLFVGLSQNLGIWYVSSKWQDTIAFLILIVFLLFRPQGFLGRGARRA